MSKVWLHFPHTHAPCFFGNASSTPTTTLFNLQHLPQNMAKIREFNSEISANVHTTSGSRKDLTTSERAAILAASKTGVTQTALATAFKCSRSCIARTIKRSTTTQKLESEPRSGRPKKLNAKQIRYLRQLVKRDPHITWAALLAASPVEISETTLRRALGPDFRPQ